LAAYFVASRENAGRPLVKGVVVRLAGSLLGVLGFWVVIWLPLVMVETSAAEPGEQALGDPNAPVTLIEYASLTCPHCAQFHTEVLPGLKERYIEDGKVRLIYRDFPLDERALMAAALAHCAGPDRYFGFLDVLFETQSSWAGASDYLVALKRLGKLGGMSDEQMDQCLADEELTNGILQTRLDGQNEHQVSSTPTLVINGEVYAGSRSIKALSEVIDPLLEDS
jgi:protein-disulfide isomerase